MDMKCKMCEREYSDEQGDLPDGFCSEACRNVYEHIYSAEEVTAGSEC
jgi:rubredoxin